MLTVDQVTKTFAAGNTWSLQRLARRNPPRVHAVQSVSFRIEKGTTFGLVGESGCGKSTLARVVAGLHEPDSGAIAFKDKANGTSPRLQMIFQDPFSSLNPRWKTFDIIAEPIRFHKLRHGSADTVHRVNALLVQVGLAPEDGQKYPHEFSGGQRQRISVARALAGEPDILVCDEPTSALDVSVQAQILNLIRGLQRDLGMTLLFISHDLSVIRHMSDRVGVMYLGRLVESASAEVLFQKPLHPYTQQLLRAIPSIEAGKGTFEPIKGEVPSPISPPPGCPFSPRCQRVVQACRQSMPPTVTQNGHIFACHEIKIPHSFDPQ